MDAHDDDRDADLKRLRSVYQDRRALVTGASGFIGSHVVEELVHLGAKVDVFIRAGSRSIMALSPEILSSITVHWGNLADQYSVRRAVQALKNSDLKPVIFHLGGQSHVAESWDRPVETFEVNTMSTLYLLRAILDEGIELMSFDLAGTSEEFGNVDETMRSAYQFSDAGGVIWSEASPLNPQSPYATSKVAADFLCRNYSTGYGIPALTTRMFNNFGPRQSPRFVTGTIITQALYGDIIRIGNTSATRDFTYVTDGARGHLYAAAFGQPGRSYALGYGEEISVLDWARLIIEIGQQMGAWREKELRVDPARERPGESEVHRLGVDYRTFSKETGWKPMISREEGIRRTIEYFQANEVAWRSITHGR